MADAIDQFLQGKGVSTGSRDLPQARQLPQARTPESGQEVNSGDLIDSFLQQANIIPANKPAPFSDDGDYATETLSLRTTRKDEPEDKSFVEQIFSAPINLGQSIFERTSEGQSAISSIERGQQQQEEGARQLARRFGLINPEEDIVEDSQVIFDRLVERNDIDLRQKQVITSILNEAVDTSELITPRNDKQLVGDVLGTVLWAVPVGHVAKGLKGASLLSTAGRGAVTGGAFGGADALSADEDLGGFIKSSVIGAAIGAPAEVGGVLLGRGAVKTVRSAIDKLGSKPFDTLHKLNPRFLQSIGARMEKDYGPEGKEIYQRFLAADRKAVQGTGDDISKLAKSGIFDMTDDQAQRFTLAAQGRENVQTDDIAEALTAWNRIRNNIADDAVRKGVQVKVPGRKGRFQRVAEQLKEGEISKMDVKQGTVGKKRVKILPFKKREDFFPHMVPEIDRLKNDAKLRERALNNSVADGFFKNRQEAEKVLDAYINFIKTEGRGSDFWSKWLVQTGQAPDVTTAKAMTARFFKPSRNKRFGPLETAREIDFPFYDPDPRSVLPAYIYGARGRLSEIEQFGDKFIEIDKLVGKMQRSLKKTRGAEAADKATKELQSLIKTARGIVDDATEPRQKISAIIRTIQIPKLAFAQVLNLGQNANVVLRTDLPSAIKALPYAFSNEGAMRALKTGATLDAVLRETYHATGITSLGQKFLKYTGFTATEKFNRVFSANAGIVYARKTANKLIKKPNSPILRGRIQELGVDPDDLIRRGGLDENQLLRAGQIIAEQTQFRGRPIDLPAFAQSPEGRVLFQYKNFAFQQTKFLKDSWQRRRKAGDYGGIMRDLVVLATLFPMTGEVIGDVRSILTGEQRETEPLDRYIENIMTVGGFGILGDALVSAGWGRLTDFIAGPTVGTVTGLVEGSVGAVKRGELSDSDVRFLLQQPGITRPLANYLFPSDRDEQETFIQTLQGMF